MPPHLRGIVPHSPADTPPPKPPAAPLAPRPVQHLVPAPAQPPAPIPAPLPAAPAAPSKKESPIKEMLHKAVKHTLEHNLNRRVILAAELTPEELASRLAAMNEPVHLGYVKMSGALKAIICMPLPESLAKVMAIEWLGYEEFHLAFGSGGTVLKDTAGECINMISGNVRNVLEKNGLNCRMYPPTAFRGRDELFSYLRQASQSWILHFKIEELEAHVLLFTAS